jgi:hypothetical protein
LVAERGDDVQPAAGFAEMLRLLEDRRHPARVGDRADDAVPGLKQAEPDQPAGPGMTGSGQRVQQRVGQQLRDNDGNILEAFCHTPPLQGAEGEFTRRPDPAGVHPGCR